MIKPSSVIVLLLTVYAVKSLDNGLARTPPMGWMSWTAFYCEMDCRKHPHACINEELYEQMADRLVSDGYREAGYVSVHVDDCWMDRIRDKNGRLMSDPSRFPSGMKYLAQYMHQRGLKFGIYEDYGTKTCAGFPGSLGHIKVDADTFADWDVDYLKLDGCNVDTDMMPIGYPEMGRALNATGRPIAYSCSWPAYMIDQPQKVNYTVIGKHCNLWRNFDDINSSWKSILSIIAYYDANQDKHIPTHGPGHWHDPDMLVIGNAGITEDMARTQMTVWSIWSAPLIMSNDLRTIAPHFREILQNRRVIAINQDPMGIMGRLVANTTDIGVYVKAVTPVLGQLTSYSIAIINRSVQNTNLVEFTLEKVGLNNKYGYKMQDLWNGKDMGIMKPSDSLTATLNPTGSMMYKATLAQVAFPKYNHYLQN